MTKTKTIIIDDVQYTLHRKATTQPLRSYVPGEDLTGVTVGANDSPAPGGMIACNPANPADKWYLSAEFVRDSYVLA